MIKLAVCMPMARGASPHTVRSLMAMTKRLREDGIQAGLFDPVGFQIDHARNRIVHEVLNFAMPDATHFMWIDDDMVFDPDAVSRLLAHDLPIVGGLCHNRRHPYHPILLHYNAHGFTFRYDYPEGLVEVDGAGAAFILVKADVYRAINEKFGGVGPYTPIDVSEDLSFCKRARECGYKIMVDTTVKIGHVGEVIVDEAFARRNRDFEARPYFEPRPMPAGPPRASIVIPTYNQRPELLRSAVESALTQTVPCEVIVIDNGSDVPVGPTLPKHPALRVARIDKNPGHPWDALNLGIEMMTTPWFTWLSSDDLFYATKIERQLAVMEERDEVLSCHGYDRIGENGEVISLVIMPPDWKTFDEQRRKNATACFINGLTVMISRAAFGAVGGFDPSFRVAADWEMWNRLGDHWRWYPIREVLATRREFADNASSKYQRDPTMRAIWQADDARIRRVYGRES